MSNQEMTYEQELVIFRAKQGARILFVIGLMETLTLVARLFGGDTLESGSLKIPIGQVHWIFLALTVAHIFWAIFIVRSVQAIYVKRDRERLGKEVYDRLRRSDNILLNGMLPRTKRVPGSKRLYAMSLKDPTTWLQHALVVAGFVAIVPWRLGPDGLGWTTTLNRVIAGGLLATFLAAINWVAGSQWILGISQLALPVRYQLGDREWYISSPMGYLTTLILVVALSVVIVVASLQLIIIGLRAAF